MNFAVSSRVTSVASTRTEASSASTGARAARPLQAPPAAARFRSAGVCFSSRQAQRRKDPRYDQEDERPNVYYGPLTEREGAEAQNEFEEKDSLALALELAGMANDTKAVDIRVLNVQKLVFWTRYFVVATCFSKPQVNACISRMEDAAAEKFGRVLKNSPAASSWVCLDFGDVVAHVFTPGDRDAYDLEGLYMKSTEVALPFVSQKST